MGPTEAFSSRSSSSSLPWGCVCLLRPILRRRDPWVRGALAIQGLKLPGDAGDSRTDLIVTLPPLHRPECRVCDGQSIRLDRRGSRRLGSGSTIVSRKRSSGFSGWRRLQLLPFSRGGAHLRGGGSSRVARRLRSRRACRHAAARWLGPCRHTVASGVPRASAGLESFPWRGSSSASRRSLGRDLLSSRPSGGSLRFLAFSPEAREDRLPILLAIPHLVRPRSDTARGSCGGRLDADARIHLRRMARGRRRTGRPAPLRRVDPGAGYPGLRSRGFVARHEGEGLRDGRRGAASLADSRAAGRPKARRRWTDRAHRLGACGEGGGRALRTLCPRPCRRFASRWPSC